MSEDHFSLLRDASAPGIRRGPGLRKKRSFGQDGDALSAQRPMPLHAFFKNPEGGQAAASRQKEVREESSSSVSHAQVTAKLKHFDPVEEGMKAAAFETLHRSDHIHLIAMAYNHAKLWEERRRLIEVTEKDDGKESKSIRKKTANEDLILV
ncbi:hypothetical protein HDU67_002521 [Dinochytrium kinnereticum]|nr:hypothetical protein HDU67_002521 [Dinochytrium kinnereticum]